MSFSVTRLAESLDTTHDVAKQIKQVLALRLTDGERHPEFEKDSPDYELLHNGPSRKLYIIDRLVNGFGVETIRSSNDTCFYFYGISYVNTGDTYTTTLCYDHGKRKWLLRSWGDIVEANEKRFRHG